MENRYEKELLQDIKKIMQNMLIDIYKIEKVQENPEKYKRSCGTEKQRIRTSSLKLQKILKNYRSESNQNEYKRIEVFRRERKTP